MALRRSTTSPRKRLLDPQASCGREISTSWFRRKRSWWPCGLALDKFDAEIEEDLENHLRNVGLGYADIYLRLYMLGSEPAKANPIIMVCCSNKSVREEAEGALRRSGILDRYPEFGLGKSPLPLEQPTRAAPLAGDVVMADVDDEKEVNWRPTLADYHPVVTVRMPKTTALLGGDSLLTPEAKPQIGRQIFLADDQGRPSRGATGGYIVKIGSEHFQILPGHLTEMTSTSMEPEFDEDDCQFDGDSDDEDDDPTAPDADDIAFRMGSASPVGRRTWDDSESEETQSTPMSAESSLLMSPVPPQSEPSPAPSRWARVHRAPASPALGASLVPAGEIHHHSKTWGKASLDYAFARVSGDETSSHNEIIIADGPTTRKLQIQDPVAVGKEERKIIAVTASGGVTHGVLIPGATYFRKSDQPTLQPLHFVQLEGVVVEGDCGAAVVDEETGALYGHIVRGCSGTGVAYIVAATEVFADMKARLGKDVLLAGLKNRQRAGDAAVVGQDERPTEHQPSELEGAMDISRETPSYPSPPQPSSDMGSPNNPAELVGESTVPRYLAVLPGKSSETYDIPPEPRESESLQSLCSFDTVSTAPEWNMWDYSRSAPYSIPAFDPSQGIFQPDEPVGRFRSSDKSVGFFQQPQKYFAIDPSLIEPRYPDSPALSGSAYPRSPVMTNSPQIRLGSTSPFPSKYHPYGSPFQAPMEPPPSLRLPGISDLLHPGGYSPYAPAPMFAQTAGGDESSNKHRCPHPDCGKSYKDLKAHMLTHQTERPEKCPIQTCEYHIKGFARKYDKNRHTLTHYKGSLVCGFCPGTGKPAEKTFNRADVFKRHLTSVHGVEQRPPNSRRRAPATLAKPGTSNARGSTRWSKCSTCDKTFGDPQALYEHLDDCVLGVVQRELPPKHQATVEDDTDISQDTLPKHHPSGDPVDEEWRQGYEDVLSNFGVEFKESNAHQESAQAPPEKTHTRTPHRPRIRCTYDSQPRRFGGQNELRRHEELEHDAQSSTGAVSRASARPRRDRRSSRSSSGSITVIDKRPTSRQSISRPHLGMNFERPTPSGKRVQMSHVANPSHLEAEDPVVLGKTRAIQHYNNDEVTHRTAMGVLLHGDAALAAQGVVYTPPPPPRLWQVSPLQTQMVVSAVKRLIVMPDGSADSYTSKTDQEMRDALTDFFIYRFERVQDDDDSSAKSSWANCQRSAVTGVSTADAAREVAALTARYGNVVDKKRKLTVEQQRQLQRTLDELIANGEDHPDFRYELVQIDDQWIKPDDSPRRRRMRRGGPPSAGRATGFHRISLMAYYKRTPKSEANISAMYLERHGDTTHPPPYESTSGVVPTPPTPTPPAPAQYACKFPPCPYTSKRESNCKQHMERAHGWEYVRTRNSSSRRRSSETPLMPNPVSAPSSPIISPPQSPVVFGSTTGAKTEIGLAYGHSRDSTTEAPLGRRRLSPPRVSCHICQKELADDRSLGRHRWEKHGIPEESADAIRVLTADLNNLRDEGLDYVFKGHQLKKIANKAVLVIDAGGGTTDVTTSAVDKAIPKNGLTEESGICGASHVDDGFRNLIERKSEGVDVALEDSGRNSRRKRAVSAAVQPIGSTAKRARLAPPEFEVTSSGSEMEIDNFDDTSGARERRGISVGDLLDVVVADSSVGVSAGGLAEWSKASD